MDINQLVDQIAKDAPLVGAIIFVSDKYIKKHGEVVDKLIEAFKAETVSCRKTNDQLLGYILKRLPDEDKPQ